MKIYDYYMSHQSIDIWYKKFQSTSGKQSGKTFAYMSTNFRYIRSYLVQFDKFREKLGKERKDWHDKLPCGQETDKHRITNLLQASFIRSQESYFYITPKGLALCDLIDGDFKEDEEWFLLFLLLLDYKTAERNLDIIYTVKNLVYKLKVAGVNEYCIESSLEQLIHQKDKKALFQTDIFWLISFSNDADFISLYNSSSESEKQILQNHVLNCSSNFDSKDLIARKYRNSGAYSGSTFNDDIKIIYFVLKVLKYINYSFDMFVEQLLSDYKSYFYSADIGKIKNFISNHKSIYIKVKQNIMGGLN